MEGCGAAVGTPYPPDHLGDHMAQQLGTPTLDPAYVIGWHVGKASADRAARELEVAVSDVWASFWDGFRGAAA